MAAVGLESHDTLRSSFGSSSSETCAPSYPRRPSSTKKVRGAAPKRIATTCTLQITRPSSVDQPRSPGKSFGTPVLPVRPPTSTNKGWTDAMDRPDQRLVSQLRVLATLASDRSETHQVLSVQRDNWNRLFHSTITMASVSAAAAAALNGAEQALGLSVVASILGLGVAALMAMVNFFQPSQLAEEQRHAARFFKRLATDVESTLETDPRLRQEASHFLQQKLGTLHALDSAFPMPLTPIVLEKFPAVVRPSILSSGPSGNGFAQSAMRTSSQWNGTGWTPALEKDLKRTSAILNASDIPTYVEMATGVNRLNKTLAITSTLMATSGVLCNMMNNSLLGAACTVGAYFVYSLSHAVQLGAAYETYRNCAGFYADVASSIETALRVPVHERENGTLFLERISLQLGRSSAQSPLVPLDQDNAGTLF